jgi:hypothetical protein
MLSKLFIVTVLCMLMVIGGLFTLETKPQNVS